MVNKLQRWVDDLMDAKDAREVTPRQVTRGMHPQVWRDLKADMRSGRIQPAIDVRVVESETHCETDLGV